MTNKAIFRKSVLGAAIAAVSTGAYQQAFATTTISSNSVRISATDTGAGNVTITANDIYMYAQKGGGNEFQMFAGNDLTISAGGDVNITAQGLNFSQANNGFVSATPTGKSLTAAATGAGGTTGTFFGNHTRVNTGDADGNYKGTNVTASSGGITNTNTFVVDANGSTTTNGTTNTSNTTTTNRTVTIGNGQTSVDTTDRVVTDFNNSSNLTTLVVDGSGSNLQMTDRNIHTTEEDVYFNGNLISNGSAQPVGDQRDVSGSVVHTAGASDIDHNDNITGSGSSFHMDTDSASLTVRGDSEGDSHGLWVTTTNTVLSGGTSSTTLTLDDDGAHLDNLLDMGSNKVVNVANGTAANDAVNKSQLDAEAAARAAADGNMQYNAASTNNAKIAADGSSLTTAINGENTRAINAEGNRDYSTDLNSGASSVADGGSLTAAINAENAKRISADNTLQTNINNEATARANADTAEMNARIAADNQLQANIDDETMARKRADHKLNNRIDDVEGGVASAIALTAAQQPSAPGKTAVSIGAGFYAGENAIGINAVHKLANNGNVGVGLAQSSGNGDTAAKLSYGFEF